MLFTNAGSSLRFNDEFELFLTVITRGQNSICEGTDEDVLRAAILVVSQSYCSFDSVN